MVPSEGTRNRLDHLVVELQILQFIDLPGPVPVEIVCLAVTESLVDLLKDVALVSADPGQGQHETTDDLSGEPGGVDLLGSVLLATVDAFAVHLGHT